MGVNVPRRVPDFDRHEIELTVAHTTLGRNGIGKLAHIASNDP